MLSRVHRDRRHCGFASVYVNKFIYATEHGFESLPVHWTLWPVLGGLVVGLIGHFMPRTMGVGYVNIQDILSGRIVGTALVALCVLKLLSWTVALSSGTSGGTLAPLFTIGAAWEDLSENSLFFISSFRYGRAHGGLSRHGGTFCRGFPGASSFRRFCL